MSQTQVLIHSTSTTHLLNNLSLAIDEVKLVRAIHQIGGQISSIEAASGPSRRTHFLRNEVVRLEKQLADVRSEEEWD
ncbi:MAG: hypothetical protein H8E21_10575 [Gammaproteobacteria bacterium]|nr:hypothetical protein [Gammaproteobacteria bacterium]MBL7000398.1 hypothetical protein [Gammaproteobacteria bacterium]